jgi:adenosylcobinamide-GDP ribazoletransferase
MISPHRSLVSALRTLTILPVPGSDAVNLADALSFFPLVGLLLGGAAAAVAWVVGGLLGWSLGAGALAVALSVILTRGLHVDGLADATDGLVGGRTRERKLAIMKDSHTGAFGVMAIVLTLLIKAVALAELAADGLWWWIPVPFIAARAAQVKLAVSMTYAREEGGTAAVFVKNAGRRHFVAALLQAVLLCGLLAGMGGVAALLAADLAALVLARRFRRAVGGVTGDLLGLGNEWVETGLLAVFAAAGPWLAYVDWSVFYLPPPAF